MGADPAGRRAAWIAAGLLAAFVVPLAFAQPYWQTVDDAFMAMVAHGYGSAAYPSAGLVFASVLYGGLIQALGAASIAGAQTYGVFTYALLATAALGCGYALWRAEVRGALAAAALLLVFGPAALYPQFTVLAGLLGVAAVLLVVADGRALAAAFAAILLVLAALVRAEAAALALVLTLPLWLPALRRQAITGAAVAAVFVAAAAAAMLADRAYYAAPEWGDFAEVNRARLAFTDYGLRQYYFREPLEAMRLGWTPNDLVMVEGWFYSDPRVFPAKRVAELAGLVSLPEFIVSNARRYDEALALFRDEGIVALILLGGFLAWRSRSRAAAWTLGLVAAAMMAFWLAGRPGISRIYYAPLAGAVLLTLATRPIGARRSDALLIGFLLLATAAALAARNGADRQEEQLARSDMCTLPPERLYVVWAERLPYEKLYRPLAAPGDGCVLMLYPLAVHSYAPYALEHLRRATGADDVIAAMLQGRELDMIADGWQIDVLRRHLRIHYRRVLQWRLLRGDGGRASWFRVWVLP